MEDSYLSDALKRNIIPILLASSGLIFLSIGLVIFFSQNKSSDQLQFEAGKPSLSASPSSPQGSGSKIVVDIEGAVMNPGIYSLPSGSRTHDLLIASGGLSIQADRSWFSKSLNQAAKLVDGQKVYIPRVGEDIMTSASTTSLSSSDTYPALIGINSASLKDLDTLPGIGPVTAQKIIDNRPYSSINDLILKKVVSSSVFEKIKDKISSN